MRYKLLSLALLIRNAFHPRHKNALRGAVLTFALSLLPLTLIYVLVKGMTQGIYERSVETFYYHAQIQSKSYDPREELGDLSPAIEGIWEERQGFGIVLSEGNEREALLLRGLEPSFLSNPTFWRYLVDESASTLSSPVVLLQGEIALGKAVASHLKVKRGDKVQLITTREIAGRRVARISPFTVKLIFSTGYTELDRTWGLVSLFEEEALFDPASPSIWGVKFKGTSLDEIPALTGKLNKEDGSLKWVPWTELNRNQRENFQSLEVLFYILFSLIVLVAGFNVSSALIIYTVEQAHTIAILKAMGTSPSRLKLAFTLLGALIGFLGSLLGFFLSLILTTALNSLLKALFSWSERIHQTLLWLLGAGESTSTYTRDDSYYLSEITASLPFSFLLLILGVSVALTMLASLLASKRLLKVKPKLLLS